MPWVYYYEVNRDYHSVYDSIGNKEVERKRRKKKKEKKKKKKKERKKNKMKHYVTTLIKSN